MPEAQLMKAIRTVFVTILSLKAGQTALQSLWGLYQIAQHAS